MLCLLLPEKGESEDDVDTLLRTTKRFIGKREVDSSRTLEYPAAEDVPVFRMTRKGSLQRTIESS